MSTEPESPDEDSPEAEPDDAFAALLRRVAAAPRVPPELLETAEVAAGNIEGPRLWTGPSLPPVGEVLDGRYRIDGELGRGGMGVVFSAHNLRTGRDVALKWMIPRGVLRSSSERNEGTQRFEREARAVSRIDHPNVVRVHDVGGDPEAPYLVMERLHGETLRARLSRGPLTWDEALSLLLPVMSGVAAAHRAGVVHRDLKPDNIFVCADGVKVLDFGVSRIGGDEDHTTLTRTGTMIGTPAYMPLEQLRGTKAIDERTDVYALGVILYEALAGRLPFDAQTAADQAVLLATRKPQPLGELVPALRGARAEAVMRALSSDPAARHQSVEAMALALGAARGARAVDARLWLWVAAALCLLTLLLLTATRDGGQGSRAQTSSDRAGLAAPPPALNAARSQGTETQAIRLEAEPAPASATSSEGSTTQTALPPRAARRPKDGLPPASPAANAPRAPGSLELSAEHFEATSGQSVEPSEARRGSPGDTEKATGPALRRDEF